MKKKKVAVFDIDGTIFRSSLLIELTDALIQEGIFPESITKIYARAYKNWLERKDSYEKYIQAVVRAFDPQRVRYDENPFEDRGIRESDRRTFDVRLE
mgnify:CR=1 FL=1